MLCSGERMTKRTVHAIEVSVTLTILFISYILAGRYDVFEWLAQVTRKYEHYELDEIITCGLVLMFCLLVLVVRHYLAESKAYRLIKVQNEQIKKVQAELKVLRGIVPICSYCKSIRDENGQWQRMEVYVELHSQAEFSHGICDRCFAEHFPEGDT